MSMTLRSKLWTPDTLCRDLGIDPQNASLLQDTIIEQVDIDPGACRQGSLYIPRGSRTAKSVGLQEVPAIKTALAKGASAALTTADLTSFSVDAPVIRIDSLFESASRLATAARNRFRGTVLGITGSVGKTTTKDLLHHVLSYCGPTHATRGNYNEIDGVLMSVASMPPDARYAVIEVCSTKPGSIPKKSKFVRPEIGLITNIGVSHGANYPSRYDILRDKVSMLDDLTGDRIAIIGRGVLEFDGAEDKLLQRKSLGQLVSVGQDRRDVVRLVSVEVGSISTRAKIEVDGHAYNVFLPVAGRHLGEAAAFVLASAVALRLDVQEVAESLTNYCPAARRGERHRVNLKGSGEIVEVIDDAQNSSPDSVRAVLDTVHARNSRRKVLVFGDMLELGDHEIAMHEALAPDVKEANVGLLVTVGPRAKSLADRLQGVVKTRSFSDVASAAKGLPRELKAGDLVILKGSGGMQLERLLPALAPRAHRARAGIRWKVEDEVRPEQRGEAPKAVRSAAVSSFEPIRIRGFYPIPYVMPLRKGFTTSRHTTTRSRNYILAADARSSALSMLGTGEASPRSIALTGDTPALAESFFAAADPVVKGLRLDYRDREASMAEVRRVMGELESLANSMATSSNDAKPFRASLAGLDMMLLDLASKAMGVTVADFLGRSRTDVPVTATTMSIKKQGRTDLERTTAAHLKRYPAVRAKGNADSANNLEILRAVTSFNKKNRASKIAWIDINEAYSPSDAVAFIDLVAEAAGKGEVLGEVIIEQPVPKRFYAEMCELQRYANQVTAGSGATVVMLADEGLWDLDDLKKLQSFGGCGAINIKVQKCGGLLRGMEIAERAMEFDPGTRIYIGGMIGTSDLTSRALLNLAAALPRFDYITSGPKTNIAANIATSPLKWEDGSNILPPQTSTGVGTEIDWAILAEYVAPEVRARIPLLQNL